MAQSGPHATGAWMNEFGAWYFDLARRHDDSFLHQGPAQMKNTASPPNHFFLRSNNSKKISNPTAKQKCSNHTLYEFKKSFNLSRTLPAQSSPAAFANPKVTESFAFGPSGNAGLQLVIVLLDAPKAKLSATLAHAINSASGPLWSIASPKPRSRSPK